VGEDPDNGTCDGVVAWHIDRGAVNGLDVSGHTLAALGHIPGNILQGNWRVVFFVDDKTTPDQQEALLSAWSGKLGGPLADLSQLVGEVAGVERVPITFAVEEGRGRLQIGTAVSAELAPYQGATGRVTTLNDTVFSTIPGSPAYVGKAATYRAKHPILDIDLDLQGHNAIQGTFRFEG
jgi:hypothetical protein